MTKASIFYTRNEEDEIFIKEDMIIDNEIIGINFTSKYENKERCFKAYEFQTNEFLYFEFHEQSDRNFRLEITNDYVKVLIAYHEDYTVMEDVTFQFDTVDLLQRVLLQNDIEDVQEHYNQWLEEESEDY